MNRLKLLVAAALLGLPLAACDSETAPPPVGQIDGQVVIEGEGIDGVSVSLSSGAATTTSGGGHYSFMDVEGGTYTITISGYPDDASFDQTTAEVTIASSGQTINRSFSGSWIRTASLMGMVTVEGVGLPGVTVAIAGRQDAQMLTDDNGQYTFTGLRAGNYTVEISGFDATDVAFSATSSAIEVSVGESKVWSFEGTYVRESTIAGQVSVEGNGLAGVTISLQGMGADESENTDMGGQFTFSNLRAGEYQLAISGYDTDEYGFSTTSATVRVEHGRTANVPFEGILLRTASIMGQVSVEGEGLAEVTVSLSGEGESLTTMTDNSGQYAFSDLPAGNFQVGISGYDTDDYSFETTSKNVALALGETATVPFEGILLRTSGISGRVSVEGMGLDSVTVTLSGDDLADDMTTMTDATGQYAIAGLAEGEYTVAISDYDDVAYVFDNTSMDVDLGDDDTQIVNFMGMHARTASVTVKLFVDEGTKNDMMDEGEMMFPTPQILGMVAQLGLPLQLPITLAGPGVLDVQSGTPMADGSVVFANLRAGSYQVVVSDISADVLALLPPALATVLQDYSYGGPATGYPLAIAVGQEATQYAPVDITHQTVNFSVNLQSGEMMGAALPGATVSFFSDMAGARKIGDAMTDADGMASLRFSRSMASNHMVYASVAAPEEGDYHTSGMMQATMWDAKYPMSMDSNDEDIVNLKADFSFSGATITTDFGGGEALGGWAISVTKPDSAGDPAVIDGAPEKLATDGSAEYSEVVDAGDLPVTYTVAVAANQENTLDGNEKYMPDTVMHTHDGLSLPATMDAGMLEVMYTTQTLKVYVHNERDQVMGFTGNVLGGDARMSGVLDIAIRYIERSSGRSRAFPATDKVKIGSKDGVYTFSNVPANAQVIVTADVKSGKNVKLLGEDELDAYTDNADNGRMGGAFGDEGGYNHTVELCPLTSGDGQQLHGECGTFAFVNTYLVFGQVWEYTIATDGSAGGFKAQAKTNVPGVTVAMTPVDNENLAGKAESFTTATTDEKPKGGTDDERVHFNWGQKAAGVYKLSVPSGWMERVGAPGAAVAFDGELSPLGADLQIDVSPTTGYVYGVVTDSKGFRVEGATVTANGASATTDAFGRYRIKGFSGATINDVKNRVGITVDKAGYTQGKANIAFAANAPQEENITLSGEAKTATVSGTVRSGGDPVAGVTIMVNDTFPLGRTKALKTGDDGTYTATVPVGDVVIAPSKAGMSFFPESHEVTTTDGSAISGLDFTGYDHGTIRGRVLDTDEGPMSGVKVTATPAGGGAVADSSRTDVRGVYSLSVPFGRYTVAAETDGTHTFATEDGDASVTVNVASGATESVDDFMAAVIPRTPSSDATLSALSLGDGVELDPAFADSTMTYTAEVGNGTASVTVMATANSEYAAGVDITPEDADSVMAGHQVDLAVGDNPITAMVTSEDSSATMTYTVTVTRAHAVVTLSAPATVDEGGAATITASVDHAQADTFMVTVTAAGDGLDSLSTNADFTFAPGEMTSTGTVTVTAANDTIRNATAQTVTVKGSTTNTDVMEIDSVVITVTDDEMVASPPRNLVVTPGDALGAVTLTWDRPIQIGSWPITGYEAEASAPQRATVSGTVDITTDPANPTAAFTGLALGVEYTFTVHAVTDGGDGQQASTTGKAMPAVDLTFTGSSLSENGSDSVRVQASLTGVSSEDVTVTVTVSDANLAQVYNADLVIPAGVQTVATDTAFVVAIDNDVDAADTTVTISATADNATVPDTEEQATSIPDDDTVPGAPGTLVFSSVGTTGFTVEWTSPSAPGTSDITSYEIRWSDETLDEDDAWTTVSGGGGARTHAITGLTTGTTYNVEVRAVSAAGNGTAQTGSQATN